MELSKFVFDFFRSIISHLSQSDGLRASKLSKGCEKDNRHGPNSGQFGIAFEPVADLYESSRNSLFTCSFGWLFVPFRLGGNDVKVHPAAAAGLRHPNRT